MATPPAECSLLGGDDDKDGKILGWAVQGVLAVFGLSTLFIKRCFEKPQRPWSIWSLDVTKQMFSGSCAHLLGMLNAKILNDVEGTSGNECSWYFIAFSLDTSFGVMFAYCGIQAVQRLAHRCTWPSLQETGRYGDPPNKKVWAKQMVVWCIITVLARMFVLCVMLAGKDPLRWLSEQIAWPFRDDPKMFLVLVTIGCPLCMNVLQLWMQDAFLKRKDGWAKMPTGDTNSGRFRKSMMRGSAYSDISASPAQTGR